MPLYTIDGIAPRLPAPGRFFVAPGAHVIGRVALEEDANVWFGCVLRGTVVILSAMTSEGRARPLSGLGAIRTRNKGASINSAVSRQLVTLSR